jgi:hypothetical protein
MVDALSGVSNEVIRQAANRLNDVGVFADEERMFPSASALRRQLPELQTSLRSNGYTGGDIVVEDLNRPQEGVTFFMYDQRKFSSTAAAESQWHDEYTRRWHRRVVERVEDWIRRLEQLKATVQGWLPSDMSIADRAPTKMHEELMRKFGVAPADMPTFEIVRDSQKIMRVQPKGLWSIGANGRLDLITAKGSWILVDQSEPLSGGPDWQYYASDNRRELTKFDQAQLLSLLG